MRDGVIWRLLLLGTVAIILLCLLDASLESDALLYFFVIIPISCLFLLAVVIIAALGRDRRVFLPAALTMFLIYGLISFFFMKHQFVTRNAERWFLWSRHYKSEVFNQPEPQGSEFKHIEWDGWGFAGVGNTTVYLVFDPADSLVAAAKSHVPGKYPGIPCTVPEVDRLEKNWYAVMFYTDEGWGKPHSDCGFQD